MPFWESYRQELHNNDTCSHKRYHRYYHNLTFNCHHFTKGTDIAPVNKDENICEKRIIYLKHHQFISKFN